MLCVFGSGHFLGLPPNTSKLTSQTQHKRTNTQTHNKEQQKSTGNNEKSTHGTPQLNKSHTCIISLSNNNPSVKSHSPSASFSPDPSRFLATKVTRQKTSRRSRSRDQSLPAPPSPGGSQESRRQAERQHAFWDTQPVPSMSSECPATDGGARMDGT